MRELLIAQTIANRRAQTGQWRLLGRDFRATNKEPEGNVCARSMHRNRRSAPQAKSEMKPYNAAALALVGWYLMVPPRSDLDSYFVYQWFQVGSFDSASACEQGRRMMINRFMGDIQKDPSNTAAIHGFDAFYYSQCLAGDDPRLEGKFGEEFRRCEAGNCKE
jgi:hypothetical protein